MDGQEDTANSDERQSQLPEQPMDPLTPPTQIIPQGDYVRRWSRSILSFWSPTNSEEEREWLEKKLRKLETFAQNQNERILYLLQQVEEQKKKNDESQAKNRSQEKKLNQYRNYVDCLHEKDENLRSALKNVKIDLNKAKQEILKKTELINVAQAKLMSSMAKEVSTEYPDDIIRSELRSFFEGDFFSWCADTCTFEIAKPKATAKRLRARNILNEASSYKKAPAHLQFDINAPDGEASLPVLQAALSTELCSRYLADPFFLAMGDSDAQNVYRSLQDIRQAFSQGKH
jgi:hypothetical protein